MIEESRRAAVIEALQLGAGVFLAADAANVTMQEWNQLANDQEEGMEWRGRVKMAQERGAEYRDRITKMRKILSSYDAAWEIIEEKAKRFQEAKRRMVNGVQMGLLP